MRYLTGFILIMMLYSASGQQVQVDVNQTNAQLAQKYFTDKEFDKAAPLFKSLYNVTRAYYYFRQYLTCMINLNQLEEAENEVKREVKKAKDPTPDLLTDWGYILKIRKLPEESAEKYEAALKIIPNNISAYINASNTFLQLSEFEMTLKVFLQAQKKNPNEKFHYELATIYLYLRNYEAMMEEYLNLIDQDENNLGRVQARLISALYLDIDNGLMDLFRKSVLKRIQANPNSTGNNRLLIWLLLQEKKFSSALRQYISLDRRTGAEDAAIFGLAQMALNNSEFSEAGRAYEYLMAKGKENPYYRDSYILNLHSSYMMFINSGGKNRDEAVELARKMSVGLEIQGYTPFTVNLVREYAHLLAFFCRKPGEAIVILEKGLKISPLRPDQAGELKTELADIWLYDNDPWEATLLYSQVIDANRDNSVGDDAKLKKAMLAYYVGNFEWAKAQLDVLKASTSKLTANNALELSLLISSNLNLDTTSVPLQLFSRADFLFFRNLDSLALATIDTLENEFPSHSLIDEILFRKAGISQKSGNYSQAAVYLEQIKTSFPWESLADDAIYQLGRIYQNNLNDPEKAMENYREILYNYQGSFFVSEARKYYRELTGETTDPGKTPASGSEQIQ